MRNQRHMPFSAKAMIKYPQLTGYRSLATDIFKETKWAIAHHEK
jgi:hypothetical protein